MTQRLRFGADFELDPGTYQLYRSGHALKLERIPMEILLLLTERPGELVSREQIVERIWGKGHHLDADNSINGAIRKIRQVLRDDPEHPRFIQTITGRGYRFMAPVVAVEDAKDDGAAPQERRRVWLTAGVSLSILLGTVVWLGVRDSQSSSQRVMVAVLPFQNLTGDAAQEYFSDGLTEEMIAQLGNADTQRLQVIARTSVMHFKSRQAPLTQIARELNVQYVLEGSVRRDGNTVRVTAQLIQTDNQTHIWAQQYDRELKDLLALQGEIARQIASEIQAALGEDEPGDSRLPAPSAQNYEAYDLYLKGLHFFNRRTVPDFERAIGFLEQATVKDPKYARVYALLAGSYELLARYRGTPSAELASKARAAALRALELDPGSAEAHTALALIVQNHDLDWSTAEREFRRAIELNPNYATAHHWYAEHLMCRGRFDEALRESERALQLDPLSLIIATDHGVLLYFSRQYDRAIETFRSVLDRDPNFPRAHIIQAAYVGNGQLSEALADLESERQHQRVPEPNYWAVLAEFYGRSGDTTQARRAFDELLRYSRRHHVSPGLLAGAYLAVGELDSALVYLERVYAESPGDLTDIKVNPWLDPLRGDPRFQSLLRRVGLEP